MRKFLIRWWFTSNWEQERTRWATMRWNDAEWRWLDPERLNAAIAVSGTHQRALFFFPPQEAVVPDAAYYAAVSYRCH